MECVTLNHPTRQRLSKSDIERLRFGEEELALKPPLATPFSSPDLQLSGILVPTSLDPEFDRFADNYDDVLNRGLRISGERREYFAEARIQHLQRRLHSFGLNAGRILDFGCGVGSSTRLLFNLRGASHVLGTDVSVRSLSIAQRNNAECWLEFLPLSDIRPVGDVNLAFTNGVFHHIPLAERQTAFQFVLQTLCRGGVFAFFENNPWNPGTRFIMHRIPFDADAVTLSSAVARRALSSVGFEILSIDYLFFFPRILRGLRRFEPALVRLPLGAQYLVMARKP